MSNLLETIDFITYNLNSDNQTDIIYLDYAKAFDKVSHNKLLIKLESYSINVSILKWIESFLKNRKQRVAIGDSFSEWKSVSSGVPQGTVLAPVLFVIYINDLPDQVKSMFKLYADDSKLGAKIENINDCIQLQEDLDNVINWANEWQMTFNINKCHSVHFSNKKSLNFNFNYSMNDQALEKSLIEKDLGILISSDLKWDNHISKITNKANSMLAMIKNSFECHDIEVIRPLYLALVRPQLEYVNSVWNPHLIRDIKKIEKIQKRATKLPPYLKKVPYINRLDRFKLTTLETRRKRGDLIEFYKIVHGRSIINWTNNPRSIENSREGLRRHNLHFYREPSTSSIRDNFFLNRTIPLWNELPFEVKDASTLNDFKAKLDAWQNKIKRLS